jgi:hypothetical protein
MVAPNDLSLCEEALRQQATPAPFGEPQDLVDSFVVAFDGDAAARCIAAYATGRCGFTPPDCKRVYKGLLPLGAPCLYTQCGAGLGCYIGFGECIGECQPLSPTGLCRSGDDGCAAGAACTGFSTPAIGSYCEPQLSDGDVCGQAAGYVGCPDDDFCSYDEGSKSGHCRPLASVPGLPPGTCCSADRECADGWACVKGVCSQHTPTGGACAVDAFGVSTCFDLEFCVDGTCIPGGRVGDKCGSNRSCVIGNCDATLHCVAKPTRGESCSSSCSGLDFCRGTCVSPACVPLPL